MSRRISARAVRTWAKLGQWYGSKLADNYGPTPPEDWCELIDRTDDERLTDALLAARRESPIFVPTLGQIEKAIPKRETGNSGPSKPERLCNLMLQVHGKELCRHQFAKPWTYFGPLTTFELLPRRNPPDYITHPDPRGVTVSECDECAKPSFRVLLDQAISTGVAA